MAKDRMVACLIHIPCQYPNGKEIEAEKINGFLTTFDRLFGGSTVLGEVPGHWLDEDLDETVSEPMLRIELAVKKSMLGKFEEVAIGIGKATKQKAIYVVINYSARPQLLLINDEDEDEGPASKSAGGVK